MFALDPALITVPPYQNSAAIGSASPYLPFNLNPYMRDNDPTTGLFQTMVAWTFVESGR